jgi:hypothetical protein
MTEALRTRVKAAYDDLRIVVDRDPKATVGVATTNMLRNLITEAKDSGADGIQCDRLLAGMRSSTISAGDALVIAGQVKALVS